MKIYPYNAGSASAKALAEALGIKRIKHEGKPLYKRELVINWGSSNITRRMDNVILLNEPYSVRTAVNKLECFKTLVGRVTMPEFTESRVEAARWLAEDSIVVARKKLTGNSGEGIVIVNPANQHERAEELPNAPLYTKYIKKTDEFRIHVFRGEVFHMQKKMRKREVPDDQVNWQIRNLAGGFIFAHQNIEVPEDAKQIAIDAINFLGLDFGAVDIIYNARQNKSYLLEVNCAPGLEGASLEKYKDKFLSIM